MKMANTRGKRNNPGGGTVLYVTVAAAFSLLAVIVAMALFFKITDITVEGQSKYSAAEIIKASGIEKDTSVFFVSGSSAQIAIKNALPYIDSVKVVRKLPGTVSIQVTESTAAAYVTFGGSRYIIDESGRVLEKSNSAGTAEIRGVTVKQPEVGKTLELADSDTVRRDALTGVLKALSDSGKLEKTKWIDLTNLSSITFNFYGYNVNIGTSDNVAHKLGILDSFLQVHTEEGYGQEVFYDAERDALKFLP